MDDRFTGGDSLEPGSFAQQLHLALMANELSAGRGAYRMANAVMAASGPSFGPFQYDLGANAHGRALIEGIARSVVDDHGRRIVDDHDLVTLRHAGYQPFQTMSAGEREAYEALKPRLSLILGSAEGRQMINADYLQCLGEKVAAVDALVANVAIRENKRFLESSPLARLIIADTRNQFGAAVNKGLQAFVDMDSSDPAVQMPARRRPEAIAVHGALGLEDLVRYKLETQYAQRQQGAQDTLRRIANLVDAVGVENVQLSREDREFFRTGLQDYLRGNGIDPGFLEREPGLRSLRALGQVRHVGADEPAAGPVSANSGQRPAAVAASPHLPSDAILRHGQRGADVARIQAQLNSHGIRDEHGRALPLTGNYLDRTQAAVASFQRTVGLEATGVADRATLSALARPAEVRYGQHGAAVTHVQKMLRAAGVDLPASGRFDYQTEGAVKDFQLAQGLMPTGVVSDETLYRLRQAERQHIAAPAPAVDRTVEAPVPATRAVLLSDPTHPDHALFSQALRGVDGLDAAHRRTADERSANAAGALTAAAREAGFERIDHVVLGEGGSRMFAVQGALDAPLKRMAWVDTVQAMTQSLELSTQRVEAAASLRGAAPPVAAAERELQPVARAL